MKIGIDVTFIKPKKTGGIEFYFLNLIKGLLEDKSNTYYIYLAKDNAEYFKDKIKSKKVVFKECNVNANEPAKHLLFILLKFHNIVKNDNLDLVFYPSYMMPFFKTKRYKTVAVVHDIQAIHYPEYFPLMQRIWFNIGWRKLMFTADRIVTITDFTNNDLKKNFKHKDNIRTIYIPILLNDDEVGEFDSVKEKYNINKNDYYYTVLSMVKHKNLITLIKMMKSIKDNKVEGIPNKLVVSGVNGPSKEELIKVIKEYDLEDSIILTGFVSNEDRNTLMKNANVFLFPSVFEGFGMPPIEAMHYGTKVITTKCASLLEVTQNKCEYVDDPYDVDEWIEKIKDIQNKKAEVVDFDVFNYKRVSKKYLDLFEEVYKEK